MGYVVGGGEFAEGDATAKVFGLAVDEGAGFGHGRLHGGCGGAGGEGVAADAPGGQFQPQAVEVLADAGFAGGVGGHLLAGDVAGVGAYKGDAAAAGQEGGYGLAAEHAGGGVVGEAVVPVGEA